MKIIRLICVLSLILGMFSSGFAQESKRIVTVARLKGTVEVKSLKDAWIPAQIGMVLKEGDIIRAKRRSWALLNLDGTAETATVRLEENSQLKLSQLLENKKEMTQSTLLDLALGKILIKAKKLHSEKSKFEVKTPTSIVGVRGTTFSVTVEAIE